MTDPYGIIDLAALKKPAGGEKAAATGEHELHVTEANLEQLINDSAQVPTLVVVTSDRVPGGDAFMAALRTKIDAQRGAVRLASVDADTQPRVAAAMRVQELPTVLLLLLGQMQPIAAAVIPDEQIDALLSQIIELARQQGMQVPEGADGETEAPAEEPLPPLMQEAMGAIEAGDLERAIQLFTDQLKQTPADVEAKAGLATVKLMNRTRSVDPAESRQRAADNPSDLSTQLTVADLDMMGGHLEDAFARLLDLMRAADPETKNALRERLLEYFDMAGPEDPRVPPARRRLASLLY